MPENATLRIFAEGGVEVDFVAQYLFDLQHAYNSIVLFESLMDRIYRVSDIYRRYREFPFGPALELMFGPQLTMRRGGYLRDWPPTPDQIASFVPPAERLVLSAVSLTSPGFWDFLGTLNPFEVLRQYLNDRHERRKDREYRESAEQRKMDLEILQLQNKVIADRVRIAKDIGATDRDLAPLLNQLINKPLITLGSHQDKGLIEHAEISHSDDGATRR